jgi:hypothetical protein
VRVYRRKPDPSGHDGKQPLDERRLPLHGNRDPIAGGQRFSDLDGDLLPDPKAGDLWTDIRMIRTVEAR